MTSKYDPFKDYLLKNKSKSVQLTLKQIEIIIGNKLPPSAYYLRQWWGNSRSATRRHVQAIAWTNAGWEVDEVDFKSQQVSFRKVN